MKTITSALLSLAVLTPIVTADFDLYFVRGGDAMGSFSFEHWSAFDKEPTCDEARPNSPSPKVLGS